MPVHACDDQKGDIIYNEPYMIFPNKSALLNFLCIHL